MKIWSLPVSLLIYIAIFNMAGITQEMAAPEMFSFCSRIGRWDRHDFCRLCLLYVMYLYCRMADPILPLLLLLCTVDNTFQSAGKLSAFSSEPPISFTMETNIILFISFTFLILLLPARPTNPHFMLCLASALHTESHSLSTYCNPQNFPFANRNCRARHDAVQCT